MNDTDLAYLAGLVDGEGCIGVYKRTGQPGYQLRLQICMSDKPVLVWVQRIFGGNLLKKTRCRLSIKQLWTWYVCDSSAERVLHEILHYLKGKFEQAYLALRFRDLVPPPGKRLLPGDLLRQVRYAATLKKLKHKDYRG